MPTTPRYQEIANDLRRRIESHEFPAGKPLPTEGGLQEMYGASRNTIRQAIWLLARQHLLETRAGQGTFITPKIIPFVTRLSTAPRADLGGPSEEAAAFPALVLEQGRDAVVSSPEVVILRCPAGIAARLRIAEGALVVSRHQERSIDGLPWSSQTTYYPLTWVTRGADKLRMPESIEGGAVEYLAKSIGLRQVGYRDRISARLSNDWEQMLFRLAPNHTVIEVYRTSFAEDETPLRVTVTVFPADRNQVVYDVGDVPDRLEEPVQD